MEASKCMDRLQVLHLDPTDLFVGIGSCTPFSVCPLHIAGGIAFVTAPWAVVKFNAEE
jgi:hypothetical protein